MSDFFNIDLKEFNNQKQTIALLFQKQISYAKQLNDLAYDLLITKPQEISQIIENHHQLFINSKNLIFLTHQFFISDQE